MSNPSLAAQCRATAKAMAIAVSNDDCHTLGTMVGHMMCHVISNAAMDCECALLVCCNMQLPCLSCKAKEFFKRYGSTTDEQ